MSIFKRDSFSRQSCMIGGSLLNEAITALNYHKQIKWYTLLHHTITQRWKDVKKRISQYSTVCFFLFPGKGGKSTSLLHWFVCVGVCCCTCFRLVLQTTVTSQHGVQHGGVNRGYKVLRCVLLRTKESKKKRMVLWLAWLLQGRGLAGPFQG